MDYLVEAANPREHDAVLELAHVVPCLLDDGRISGFLIPRPRGISLALQEPLREAVQLDRRLGAGGSGKLVLVARALFESRSILEDRQVSVYP